MVGDDSLSAGALSVLAFGRFRAGLADGLSLVEQAAQLATSAGDPRQQLEINFMAVNVFVWAYQLDRARTLLQSIDREWSERDEPAKAYVLWWLGMIELPCGRFPVAADYAERSLEIERQYMIGDREEPDVWLVALIAAQRGELDLARSLTESNRPLTDAPSDAPETTEYSDSSSCGAAVRARRLHTLRLRTPTGGASG